jgi:Ni/Co efflux regulator RcnB
MSRSEDYLDNLLTSVTDRLNEFDDDFEQNRESFKESYQTQNDLPSKTQSALDEIREENFLREFEDELNKGRADEDFLAEFERELNGEDVQPAAQEEPELDLLDELFSQMNEEKDDQTIEMPQPDQTDADPFADVRTMEPDEAASSSDEHTLEPDFLSDEDLTSMLKEPEEEPAVPDLTSMLKEPEEEPAIPDFSGFDDEPATAAMDSGNDEATTALNDEEPQTVAMDTQEQEKSMEAPKGMEGLEDIFGDILGDDADSLINELENGTLSEDADRTQQNTEPILDDRLKDILDGSDEDALSEIDQLLDADSDSGTQEKEDPLAMAPDFSYEESSLGDGETGEKKKREKNKNGLFGKISRMLFGTPAELDPEAAAEYEAAKAAMKQTEEDPKAVKERKKQEKEQKKQQKKEEAEKKKQEKDAAKAEKAAKKAAKPKKEKKPKQKKQVPKEPPLPKVPVMMMWILALSLMVLVFLGTFLIGYSTPVKASKEAFEKGDYVTAYEKLQGIKVRAADKDLLKASSALAGIQAQLDAYIALMEQKQYEMALDALIRGYGRCLLNSADAEEWGVLDELEKMQDQFDLLLKEQFDVTKHRAKKLYNINKRSEYTLALHEILDKLGLEHN